jgi:hypothetical protein
MAFPRIRKNLRFHNGAKTKSIRKGNTLLCVASDLKPAAIIKPPLAIPAPLLAEATRHAPEGRLPAGRPPPNTTRERVVTV